MPRRSVSGTVGLIKRHSKVDCRPADPCFCDCQWRGRLGRKIEVVLSKWADCEINPHSKDEAKRVLRRLQVAVNEQRFDPSGEQPITGDEGTVAAFITEWKSRYAQEYGLTANSLDPMLNVIARSRLGRMPVATMATAVDEIERWLNHEQKARGWKNKTWNGYHGLLNRLLKQATIWRLKDKPRLMSNPMTAIERKVAEAPEHFRERHLVEEVEARLFATVGQLKGSKSTEMERRLIGAFDGGLRAGEMQLVQLQHVNWKPVVLRQPDGTRIEAYDITLPAAITKGGKTSGQVEHVYAVEERFRHMLERRRFALKNNKPERQFIWGTEDGSYQHSFRRQWRKLFTLSGLAWGRSIGVVWHTTRHEYISRVVETSGDPVMAQQAARHKDLKTTRQYMHTERNRLLTALAGLGRGKR